jgi:hypothetical protein
MPQDPSPAVAGKPIEAFRRDLLYMAFQAASALPMNPHQKSRGRAQEKVALACLELGQPALALEFGRSIADWRRGNVLADCAHFLATHGDTKAAAEHVATAAQIAQDTGRDADSQEWRRDTILNKVARAQAALGNLDEARKVAASIDPNSGQAFDAGWAATASSRADLVTAEMLDAELAALDGTLVSAGSGQAFNVVAVCVRLYDKFFADAAKRDKVALRVRTRDSKLPPDMHVSGLVELARVAAKHGNTDICTQMLFEAREYLRGTELGTEYTLGIVPVMATIRGQVGATDAAKAELAEGITKYHAERESFRGTKRAEILRPFAEAWHTIGDEAQATGIYELVLEEGMENPNSRPRAHDVSETCLSMARHGFQPNETLRRRIREILDGLGEPW